MMRRLPLFSTNRLFRSEEVYTRKSVQAISVVASILLFLVSAEAAVVDAVWVGPATGNWNVTGNWDIGTVPNNGTDTYNVFIDDETVQVNGSFTVDTINVSGSDGITNIGSTVTQSLSLVGATSTVNGQIRIGDYGSYAGEAYLYVNSELAMQGNGSVSFVSNGYNYISGSGVLTIGSALTLQSLGSGTGNVNIALVNNGTIQSNGGTITLNENITNNNVIRSLSGTLNLSTMTVDNSAGQLSAASDAAFNINSSTIAGGTLTGDGTFNIGGVSTFDGTGGMVITDSAVVSVGYTSNEYLTVKKGVINNGQIKLSDARNYAGDAQLILEGLETDRDVAFEGTGAIIFTSNGTNGIYASSADTDARLKIGSEQVLQTATSAAGGIYSEVLNNGIISASSGTITLYENVVNNNQIRVNSSGVITLDSLTVDNSAGQISVESGGEFNIKNTAVTAGLLTGGGVFNIDGSSSVENCTIDDGTAVKVGSTSGESLIIKDGLINNHEIQISDATNYAGEANLKVKSTPADSDVQLTGDGRVIFTTNSSYNRISADSETPDARLVIGSAQTITTAANADGVIEVEVLNDGTIESGTGGDVTISSDITNNNVIRTTGTGRITLDNQTIRNSAGTITASTDGIVYLVNSAIEGGNVDGGGKIVVSSTGRLDGSTTPVNLAAGSLETGSISQRTLTLEGTINNNSTIKLLDYVGYAGTADMVCDGQLSLNGSGQLVFASNGGNYIKPAETGGSLVIGANQTIKADSGHNGYIQLGTINNGTIAADGGTVTLPSSLTNNGLVRSSAGSTLTVSNSVGGTGGWLADGGTIKIQGGANVTTSGDITIDNGGKLQLVGATITGSDLIMGATGIIDIASSVSVSGDVEFAMADEAKWKWSTSSILQMTGGISAVEGNWGAWGSLEIGGSDLGTDPDNHIGAAAGFVNNFSLPQLVIGADAHIYLADLIDNGNQSGSYGFDEALYVGTLTFADGNASLNLNGLHLYYDTLEGSLEQIIDVPVPEPATVCLLGLGALSILRRKRN